jgi:hypothetical protein
MIGYKLEIFSHGLQMKHDHEYFCFGGTLGVVAHRFLLQKTCSVEAHLQSYHQDILRIHLELYRLLQVDHHTKI